MLFSLIYSAGRSLVSFPGVISINNFLSYILWFSRVVLQEQVNLLLLCAVDQCIQEVSVPAVDMTWVLY